MKWKVEVLGLVGAVEPLWHYTAVDRYSAPYNGEIMGGSYLLS
jgi:hypothetical protein